MIRVRYMPKSRQDMGWNDITALGLNDDWITIGQIRFSPIMQTWFTRTRQTMTSRGRTIESRTQAHATRREGARWALLTTEAAREIEQLAVAA